MALFKADMDIMKEYSRLCEDRITETLISDLLEKEYKLTETNILGRHPRAHANTHRVTAR